MDRRKILASNDDARMKYSYTVDGLAQSVVVTDTGRVIELRRGDLTGEYLRAAGRRTWASEAEWKAELPTGTELTRTPGKCETPNPVLNELMRHCGHLTVHDTIRQSSQRETILHSIRLMQEGLARGGSAVDYYRTRIAELEERLETASLDPVYYSTGRNTKFYYEPTDGLMVPVYLNKHQGLLFFKDRGGKMKEITWGHCVWIPHGNHLRRVSIRLPGPTAIPEAAHVQTKAPASDTTADDAEWGHRRRQMLAGLASFLLTAYQLYKP